MNLLLHGCYGGPPSVPSTRLGRDFGQERCVKKLFKPTPSKWIEIHVTNWNYLKADQNWNMTRILRFHREDDIFIFEGVETGS